MTTKTCSTHHQEPLEKTTAGRRYFVIDDHREVFGADLAHDDALRCKDRVAGNLWSRTPRIEPMPVSAELAAKVRAAATRRAIATAPPPPAAPVIPAGVLECEVDLAPAPAPAELEADPLADELEGESVDEVVGSDDDLDDLVV